MSKSHRNSESPSARGMKSVCFVVSDPLTAEVFLKNHLRMLARCYRVSVVFNPNAVAYSPVQFSIPGVETIPIPIRRKISPKYDLLALAQLVRLFRKRKFDATHSVTPKAGFLNVTAGVLASVPIIVHIFTGQVWATKRGVVRQFLKACDMLIAKLATHLLADSFSQRAFLIDQGVVRAAKISVLGNGSISGVNTHRFKPDQQAWKSVRNDLEIPEDACVFLFTGRLNTDKGVLTLAQAFAKVARTHPQLFLLVVGPDEAGMRSKMEQICRNHLDRIRFIGFTNKPERYMAAADVFCLPSRREGFGSVVIEAAAVGVPTIASRIYGLTDAVEDKVTGLLHAPGDFSDLAAKMSLLADSPATIRSFSGAARRRVLRQFTRERLTEAFYDYYAHLLK